MFKNQFENPNKDEVIKKENSIRELPPDVKREQAMILLGTINATLDNLSDLKFHILNGDKRADEAVSEKRYHRNIINDHFRQIELMLETKQQDRIKELFEFGPDKFLINNGLN